MKNTKSIMRRLLVALFALVMLNATILADDEERVEVLRTPVVIDRLNSAYASTSSYRTALQYKMNCYGYAIHVFAMDSGTQGNPYKQQPGEFARDNQTFQSLKADYSSVIFGPNATGTGILDFIQGKMYADFQSLNTYDGAEWTIQLTTASATVPTGYRKIALAVGVNWDYHFYLRHSDGTWSHKPGSGSVTTLSIDSGVAITDSNIATCVTEGYYDDGVRYYLIGKSAIADYPHNSGHSDSSLYSSTAFRDRAGDDITKATGIAGSSTLCHFDYPLDTDYYEFIPSVSATYNITTSLNYGSYDTDIVVFNSNNTVLASDYTVGNANINISLIAGQKYYIKVTDGNHSIAYYTLYYTH